MEERLTELKRELVLLLGGRFCKSDDEETCETCGYNVPGRSLVFHDASYEYPNDGRYSCIDDFLSDALRVYPTKFDIEGEEWG